MPGVAELFLSKNHLRAIGLVAAEWSYTEFYLEKLIWELAGIDTKRGYAITTHLASEIRINILATLASQRLPDQNLKKKLKSTIAKIRKLRIERNNIVHALWLLPNFQTLTLKDILKRRKPTPSSIKIQAKGKLDLIDKRVTTKYINSIADEIGELVIKMADLLHEIQAARQKREELVKALQAHQTLGQIADPKPTTHPKPLAPSQE